MPGFGFDIFRYNSVYSAVTDSDAQAFINAANITDQTQKDAINQLVLDLKSANIWTKMHAVYPMIGGSASSHKWNLKDPRDLDAAYRLTFAGGWTHSSTGALPNGTNAYADTYLNTLANLSSTSFSMGTYLNSALISNRYHLGVSGGTASTVISMRNSNTATKISYVQSSVLSLQKGSLTTTSNQGFWALSKRSDSDRTMICSDGTFVSNTSASGLSNPSLNIYIGAHNVTGIASSFDTMSHAFDFISSGLIDAELTNLRTAIINFQTTLGRNV